MTLSASSPKPFAPSGNGTIPVGVPTPVAALATVAVNVTDWPKTVGFIPDTTTLVVDAWFTGYCSAGELLGRNPLFEVKKAVIGCCPAGNVAGLVVNEPPLNSPAPT